ncbi:MAG TPA: hypothetical protein PK122_01300 [Candidatus Paceibacterota bacterium]|jgi:hypothetical protein|nr:hypothetical protein [Candidatus Paceibacterota bacterium]
MAKDKTLNEAQIGDKVLLGKERGYLIGQTSDGQWIVQIQGSTKMASDKEVKVIRGLAQNSPMKPPMKFDEKTQKLLFEQFVRCGIFYGSVPIKTNGCYVRYSDMLKTGNTVNVLIEGVMNVMPMDQVKVLENPQDFANPGDYVEGVEINTTTGEATANIMIHAGDYTSGIGDADPVRIIRGIESDSPILETLPKGQIRTLSV